MKSNVPTFFLMPVVEFRGKQDLDLREVHEMNKFWLKPQCIYRFIHSSYILCLYFLGTSYMENRQMDENVGQMIHDFHLLSFQCGSRLFLTLRKIRVFIFLLWNSTQMYDGRKRERKLCEQKNAKFNLKKAIET